MICKDIYIEKYDWLVHCFFAVDTYYTRSILATLNALGCSNSIYDRVSDKLRKNDLNTGFTYSNKRKQESLFVVSIASSGAEYFNSISHELRHLCDDIASVYDIPTNGEEIAYLTGDVAMEMKDVLSVLICDCQCCQTKRYKKIR